MKIIESTKIKEKAYFEKVENGLNIIIIPKANTNKKYVVWGTNFGSIDNRFIMPQTNEEVFIPDGVAHFLEHKMFEQKNGRNSLDVLMALGLDANAYTTNDHTAYLFECSSDKFYEGLDELLVGPTAVVMNNEDYLEAAKTIYNFSVSFELTANNVLIYNANSNYSFDLITDQVTIPIKNIYIGDNNNMAQLANAYLYDETQTGWVNVNTGEVLS